MRLRLKIVENSNLPAFAHKQIDHMRTDQARPTGNERSLLVHSLGQIRRLPSPARRLVTKALVAGAQ